MKQAIIFGGAFNPPSRGHVWILSECVQLARQIGAEVWILPSGERSDKHIEVDRELRLELCRAMIRDAHIGTVRVRVIEDELDREIMVETIDTVHQFVRRYPEYHLRWVFGADSYTTMHNWHGGDWLVKHLDMIVVTRAGYDVTPRNNVTVLQGVHENISSTQIRIATGNNTLDSTLVTPHVANLLTSGKIRYTRA